MWLGRREEARAPAGFIPHCIVLFRGSCRILYVESSVDEIECIGARLVLVRASSDLHHEGPHRMRSRRCPSRAPFRHPQRTTSGPRNSFMARRVDIEDLGPPATDHVNRRRVEEYVANLDHMPPVVVYRTPEGLLLVDGYHRVAAALRLGRTSIEADIRDGTRSDALEFAIANAAKQGVAPESALAAIKRRHQR
ncbi:MAG: hypothetical protein GEU68_16085 [Actinobacteria bacterium]|nr:hypothetical protein [Actinomycetota bacterium]